MPNYLIEAQSIAPELTELRRTFHMDPELGNREFHTAERIEAALRADMDALPLTEVTGADFASRNPGVMHACGHDVHMTAALGAARLLANRRQSLKGSVVFLFQPDEEGRGGAQRMIDAGALEGVDAVFGAHVSPDLPVGHVGVRYGKFYAASDTFKIVVRGVSAHGAEREKGIDALGAAAALVSRLIDLPKQLPGERAVLSVGSFHAGAVMNALADTAEFEGIIRTLGPAARTELKRLFRVAVDEVMAGWGATAEVNLRESYPGVVNDDAMTALVERAARGLLGGDRVRVIDKPTMTTEDFGYFLMEKPGSFYHIGAGCPLPLHNTAFLPDEQAPVAAAAVHAAVIEAYLTDA